VRKEGERGRGRKKGEEEKETYHKIIFEGEEVVPTFPLLDDGRRRAKSGSDKKKGEEESDCIVERVRVRGRNSVHREEMSRFVTLCAGKGAEKRSFERYEP